jgi:hypothetical protein
MPTGETQPEVDGRYGTVEEKRNIFGVVPRKPGESLFGVPPSNQHEPLFSGKPEVNATVFGQDKEKVREHWEDFVSHGGKWFERQYGVSFESIARQAWESFWNSSEKKRGT